MTSLAVPSRQIYQSFTWYFYFLLKKIFLTSNIYFRGSRYVFKRPKQDMDARLQQPISSLHLNRHHSCCFAFEALLVLFQVNWDPRDKAIRDKNAGLKIGTGIGFCELYPDAIFDDVVI